MPLRFTREVALVQVADFLWPPACPICGQASTNPHTLCAGCWSLLTLLGEPKCEFCGAEVHGRGAPICLECYDYPRSWGYGDSCVLYEGTGRLMVLRLKNMRAEHLAPLMATIALENCPDAFAQADLILPIPLHWSKLIKRGFNQAALMGYWLAKHTGLPMDETVLKRNKRTKAQAGFKAFEGRFNNLEDAFSLRNPENIADKNVLIIDDVMTSGASFENAARTLLEAKPKSIGVFAFARAGQGTSDGVTFV